MEIPFNLRALINKHNRVALPGIGAFYKKRTEGFFDEHRNCFFPPKEDISFSYNANENSDPHLETETELNFVSTLTQKIKEAIIQSGEFGIEDLGNLKKKGDVIVFEKTLDQHNFNSSFFGLPTLEIPKEEVKETQVIISSPSPVNLSTESESISTNFSLAEQAMSVSVASPKEEIEEPKFRTWLYVILCLIILGLGGFAFYQFRPDIADNIWKQLYPEPKPKMITPALAIDSDSINKQLADSIYDNHIEAELANQGFQAEKVKDSTDVTIQPRTVPNQHSIRYEIIISAWRTEAKAQSELQKLRANGIDAHIVDDDGLMIKISAATLYSKEEADKELKRIREELNPEAFIKPIKSLN